MDLFKELIPSILQHGEYILEDEKDYVPFVVNSALSYHLDCILYAQQMNMNHLLDKKMQYDYLFHKIRKYKRPYKPWIKKKGDDDLELVKQYYQYSTPKARDALAIMTEEQLIQLRKTMDRGGTKAK